MVKIISISCPLKALKSSLGIFWRYVKVGAGESRGEAVKMISGDQKTRLGISDLDVMCEVTTGPSPWCGAVCPLCSSFHHSYMGVIDFPRGTLSASQRKPGDKPVLRAWYP
jgi:hypothetical protein